VIRLDAPARRPWVTLAVAAVLVAASVLGLMRMHPDPSMASLLPRHDPAAAALGHVLSDFTAVDDLQVLVSTPADQPPDRAKLLKYAAALEAALEPTVGAGSPRPELSNPPAVAESVEYKPAADVLDFFADDIAPAGVDYLSDARYAEAKKRLTRPEMDAQLRQDEAMISAPGPAAEGYAKVLLQDPLRLRDFITAEFHDRAPAGFGGGSDGYFSPDGRSLLIRVGGKRPLDDLAYAHRLTDLVTAAAARCNTAGLRIDISGGYAIAAESEKDIRRDMIVSVVSSVVLLQILFVIAYRKPFRYFLLAFGPVAIGLTLGFGVRSLISPTISPAAAVVGAVLAGMGIDYTVLYLPHYQRARAAGLTPVDAIARTSGRLISPLIAACVTSMIGFGVVGFSSVPALTDFAVVGSLGLIGSLLSAVIILPALLAITDDANAERRMVVRRVQQLFGVGRSTFGVRRFLPLLGIAAALPEPPRPRFRLEPFVDWAVRSRRPLLIAWAALGVVAIAIVAFAPGPLLSLESDLTVMHPRPNPPLEAETYIARRMGFDPGSMQIYLHADNDADLVAAAYDVSARLASPAVRDVGVVGTYGLSTWLPDPRAVARRAGAYSPAGIDRVIADFRAAVADSSFDPAAFTKYEVFLRLMMAGPPAPTVASLAKHKLLAKTMLSRNTLGGHDDHEAITVVLFDKPLDTRDQREAAVRAVRAAVAGVPGATVTGLGVVGLDTERVVRSDLPKLLTAAVVLHVVYLLVHLRRWSSMVLALTPATISLIAVAAFLRLSQQKLNMVNLISLPLLIGIAVDYGIYVVSLARPNPPVSAAESRERVTTSGHSILISATSNVLGFGSLATVSVPAIRSLGFAVGIGVTACFAATMLLLVPVLIRERN
jgi:predicted RND superfamily exporter protein